jgi:hypothetical protein
VGDPELVRVTWWLTAATWFLAAGTVVFLWMQLRESKKTTALNLHLQYLAAWEAEPLSGTRMVVARALLDKQKPLPRDIETILDHLEGVGYDANRGNIDLDRVWNDFGYAVRCYWHELNSYVLTQRGTRSDITLFEELQMLDKTLAGDEASRRRLHPDSVFPNANELHEFLISEAGVGGPY